MKTNKIVFWISSGMLTAMMMMSVGMYFLQHAEIAEVFSALGHPAYIIYPLAIAKLLGIAAIWSRLNRSVYEWAYAGFFFNFLLAIAAHLNAGDGEWMMAGMALMLLVVSYVFQRRAFPQGN